MYAFGLHSNNDGEYVSMKVDKGKCSEYCKEMRVLLGKYFEEEMKEMIDLTIYFLLHHL